MLDDLRGRAVLITGSSTGIGAAAALAFAKAGAKVCVHYHAHREEAEHVADLIRADSGEAHVLQADLTTAPESAAGLVNDAAEAMGGLDVLINNAGSLFTRTLFMDWDEGLYDQVMNLNVRSVISGSQAAVPHLEKRQGAIVNLGSIAGSNGGAPGSGMYASAKGFIHNLTRHMASDLAKRGIRVNAIAPGVIKTPFHDKTPPERMQAMLNAVPLGRLGVAEECSGALLFLASNAMSGYITGQILHVNGGQYMPA